MLLDTHVLLWVLDGNSRLGPLARQRLGRSVQVQYSTASIWELTIKAMLGSLDLGSGFDDGLRRSGLDELPVTGAHSRGLMLFPALTHHDPSDRLLAAQATLEGVPLLTVDRVLLATEGLETVDAAR